MVDRRVFCVGVDPLRRGGDGPVTIGALELDDGAVRAAADGFHVDGMIQFDRLRVALAFTECRELRVAMLETADMWRVTQRAVRCFEIAMAFGAGLIARGGDASAAAMFTVTGRAADGLRLRCVMDRTVVTGPASVVGGLGGEDPRLREVAGGTFFLEDGVGGAHTSARIDARIHCKAAP